MTPLEKALGEYKHDPSNLIAILHYIQEKKRVLSDEDLISLSKKLNVPLPQVYHVASFFSAFSLEPLGTTQITICTGTTCWLSGGSDLLRYIERKLGIKEGERTSDGRFTVKTVNCFGACSVSPAAMVGGKLITNVTKDWLHNLLSKKRKK